MAPVERMKDALENVFPNLEFEVSEATILRFRKCGTSKYTWDNICCSYRGTDWATHLGYVGDGDNFCEALEFLIKYGKRNKW